MTPEQSEIFKVLDNYARTHHKCFLAEMFLSKNAAEYVFCFRPTDVRQDSPGNYACRYLKFALTELKSVSENGMLNVTIGETLARELQLLHAAAHRT